MKTKDTSMIQLYKKLIKYDIYSRILILKWIKQLSISGRAVGFNDKISKKLAISTVIGSVTLLENKLNEK